MKRLGNRGNNMYNGPQEEEENPFRIPTDEEVFIMRDKEKRLRQTHKQLLAKLPVHKKGTWSTRLTVKRYRDPTKKGSTTGVRSGKHTLPPLGGQSKSGNIDPMPTAKKENMTKFIEKKRKMFLLQMALDTKKFEIKKLERKAEEREKKLAIEEAALIKDAHRFDDYLTENDINAVGAINRADVEQKNKAIKQAEIKKLNARIQSIQNDTAKLDEQLANCEKYKEFLDELTPPEWTAEQKEKIRREMTKERLMMGEDPDDIVIDDDEIEVKEMYFKEPEQLLNIFATLESQNLFLIQTSQEVEEQLEQIQKVYRNTQTEMSAEAENLQSQIDQLRQQINIEKSKENSIAHRGRLYHQHESEEKKDALHGQIKDIYLAAKLEYPATGKLRPLQMLTKIETKLEAMLEIIEQYQKLGKENRAFVEKQERILERARRKVIRDQRANNFKRSTSHRRERVRDESKDNRTRATGRPLMFRSPPVNKKKKKEKKKKDNRKQDAFHQLFYT